ncbi:MAG: M20/M25/M40 family metallo-hydrolase [Nocardioides sp.]
MSRATDLLAELVRADTVGAHEAELGAHCAERLEKAGLEGRWVDFEDGREQYVARAGGDVPLTFTGHLDVVPVSRDDWSVDPFGAEVDGDTMVGRGTSDMKSGVAALVEAVAAHAAVPHRCRGVQVVLTAGEETGCTGALTIPRDALLPGGPLVVAEPTRNALVPGHKGAHWMRLSATGKAAHGSAPELGDNAAVKVARAAVALHDFDRWPAGVTANVGVVRGGVQTNVVPDTGELLLDVRTVPDHQGDVIRDLVRSLVGDDVRVDDHVVLPPVDTAIDDPFVALVGEALTAVGLDGSPVETARYFTDAAALIPLLSTAATTPTVVLGPGEPEQCHVADEWCSLARVDEAVTVYEALLERWCAG